MLPQAFGPFRERIVRNLIINIIDNVNFIFVRDSSSAENLIEVGADLAKIRVAPDITNIIEGKKPHQEAQWYNRVCIVPNKRMMDMTKKSISGN